ncbi:adenylyltransferase/cytidyltransferase family protein [Streptococcus suis]|uniref:adenylyltransferase/cytidyltransferase family protein n=1 Tax=Streptococcus suis TaxID=1307 RepID=UPI000CF4EC0D|nr:adenylyltransferase/cytidyltransferase family protein [Streptococcus suis]HEM4974165.1 adenylyltransferase/cytidyltransferase family protein [Streptococcus suis]HEM5057773.1 adenylyltransferase/cytidyltransferase family protein [Streptococcus suis]HEM5068235.1 adenylyltransferase/cytidyltransferase family protein [Streptococcus suis]HEM5164951.1 adenylyltransferase/cytidyltransferase family protein [Streptococcus suis]HEM5288066.1 adenylyltransferase/cytidyltransferase family protein [Strep
MIQTIAVVFGTFAPMHKGHLDLIERAKLDCGQVCVVVSGFDRDRGDLIGLDLLTRFRAIQSQFEEDDFVEVRALDETDLPAYPDGWDLWLDRLLGLLDLSEHQLPVFYVSEEEYAQELQNRGYQAHYSPRKFGISATLIREQPQQYQDYIAPAFLAFFGKERL